MAVPVHVERDYEFASKYDIPIIEVVAGGDVSNEPYGGDGEHINSGCLNGLSESEAITKAIQWLEDEEKGKKEVTYRLRDWVSSRQRYGGEPSPIIHWEDVPQQTVTDNR